MDKEKEKDLVDHINKIAEQGDGPGPTDAQPAMFDPDYVLIKRTMLGKKGKYLRFSREQMVKMRSTDKFK